MTWPEAFAAVGSVLGGGLAMAAVIWAASKL